MGDIQHRGRRGSAAGLLLCVLVWGWGETAVARADEGSVSRPAYDRTGFHLGVGGVYSFEDFAYDIDSLGVGAAFDGNFDPRFDDSAGIDVLIGYRLHRRFDIELQYEWLEGSDSTRGDPALEIDTHLLVANGRVFLLTERWQPYLSIGVGALLVNTEIVDEKFKKPYDMDVGPVLRFGGGLDFYAGPHWVVGLEGSYLVPFADVDDANYGTLGLKFSYRF